MDHLTITSREASGGKVEYTFLFRSDALGPRGESPLAYAALQMHRNAVNDRMARFTYEDPVRTPAEDLREIGQLIAGKLISSEMARRVEAIAGPFLRLEVDAEAARIPWELAYLGGDHLGSRLAIGRSILTGGRTAGTAAPLSHGAGQFRMLMVGNPSPVADREDLPDAVEELSAIQAIARELGGESAKGAVLLHNTDACLMKLEQVLETGSRYQVFHFAGHCEFVEEDPDATGLVFPEGILSPGNLAQFFGGQAPRLIFVNACESAKSRARTPGDVRNRLTLPQGFIEAGVEVFVGCLWRVEDQAVRQVSTGFYRRALAGVPVGLALRDAKRAVDSPWMSRCAYIMYGNPGAVLSGPRPDYVLIRLAEGERELSLVILPGAGLALDRLNGERILLPQKLPLALGRRRPTADHDGADVVLRLPSDSETACIGRIHLEINWEAEQGLTMVDRSSTGTLVDGVRVKAGEKIALKPGSRAGLVPIDPALGRGTALIELVVPSGGRSPSRDPFTSALDNMETMMGPSGS